MEMESTNSNFHKLCLTIGTSSFFNIYTKKFDITNMNKKYLLIIVGFGIVLISLNLSYIISSEKVSVFNINSYDDLENMTMSLSDAMWEAKIFLEMNDIHRLVSSDSEVDLIRFYPNKLDGYSGGKGTWDGGYSLNHEWQNGTRIWQEFSNNGTLLKSINIHDEPEREILIILK